jgi:hypothetical protein
VHSGARAALTRTADCAPRRRHRFAYLLIAELALIVLYPFFGTAGPHPGLFGVFAVATIVGGLCAIVGERRTTIVALVLGTPAIVGNIALFVTQRQRVLLPMAVCGILFFFYVITVILHRVLVAPEVTMDTLFGAIAAYLLIGVSWGMVYGLIEHLHPGSFRVAVASGKPIAWPDFTFFSFVTLTSTGYGDMVPLTGYAKSLAILEAVVGVMYPAVLIGRLIGLSQAGAGQAKK